MGHEVWFRDDIRNILLAAEEASASAAYALGPMAQDENVLAAYRQGYRDALATIAVAFGLAGASPSREILPHRKGGEKRWA